MTKEDEKQRQDTAKKQNNKQKCLSSDNCKSTPSNSKHVNLTNDVSLLDASIANVLSFEKLKGDTINLHFDFLRQRSLSKQESISSASSYFYASLDKPENMLSYKNYVGKNPLQNYDYLIIPLHLPTVKHWLLAIISIINLCIYIWFCQLSREHISINIPNPETKVYQERTTNLATTTMYAVTRG